ncbi:MAG: Hsp20/alpha crystallin family protein [Pseudomonadota bacterium]
MFTADLPGVARDDLSLAADGTHLEVTTSGARLFEARVDLGKPFDLEGIDTQLHNGVLTLNIPKLEAT